ncbi:hypothetical protein DXG01_010998, partial [Tephrocybe rancida]
SRQAMRVRPQSMCLAPHPTFQEPDLPDMNMEWESTPMDHAHAHHVAYLDDQVGETTPAVPYAPYMPDLSTNHHDAAKPQVNTYNSDDAYKSSGSYGFDNAHFAQSGYNQRTEFDHHEQSPYTDVDDQQVPYMEPSTEPGYHQEPPYAASGHHHQAAYTDQTRNGYEAPPGSTHRQLGVHMDSTHRQEVPYTESSGDGYEEAPHTPYNRPGCGHLYLQQHSETNHQGPPRARPGSSMGPPRQQYLAACAPPSGSDVAGSSYSQTPRRPHM